MHTQLREILGVDKQLYGVASLRPSVLFLWPESWVLVSPLCVTLFATVPTSGVKKKEGREERNQWEFASHSSPTGRFFSFRVLNIWDS